MPIVQPSTRIRFSMPPASPLRSSGAAAIVALLFGAMNMPSPTPNSMSAPITPKWFTVCPARLRDKITSAPRHSPMADVVIVLAPTRS